MATGCSALGPKVGWCRQQRACHRPPPEEQRGAEEPESGSTEEHPSGASVRFHRASEHPSPHVPASKRSLRFSTRLLLIVQLLIIQNCSTPSEYALSWNYFFPEHYHGSSQICPLLLFIHLRVLFSHVVKKAVRERTSNSLPGYHLAFSAKGSVSSNYQIAPTLPLIQYRVFS